MKETQKIRLLSSNIIKYYLQITVFIRPCIDCEIYKASLTVKEGKVAEKIMATND